MTATHHATMLTTAHPALLVHFCGNCGERLWGEILCPHCHHKNDPPQCGDIGAAKKISCVEQKQAS
ncbi:MAG: hypothetical protein AB7D37_11205 [Desulfovibrio sp.]